MLNNKHVNAKHVYSFEIYRTFYKHTMKSPSHLISFETD